MTTFNPPDDSLFAHGLARRDDPDTSQEAARQANAKRAIAVRELMADGRPRTDEEIAAALGFTASSACHGRLAVERAGLIRVVGKGTTSHGGRARVWQWTA